MTGTPPAVESVSPAQVPRVEALLAASDLPHRDVGDGATRLYGIREGGELVAAAGLEPRGSVALLRSVVVEESRRGGGLGTRLCDGVEAVAVDRGVDALYLLTTSAAGFFADRGFAELDRAAVPSPIQETTEFAELCPTTATCMRKDLPETADGG